MGRCLQQTWAVSILLWVFEAGGVAVRYRPVGLSESTRRSRHFKYSLELYLALWYWAKHSLWSWVGMLWFHRSRKFFDLLEDYESNWDDFGSSVSILVIDSYIWDVGEAYLIASCEYVRYSGIVRTMPTYSSQPPGTWSGELHYDLYACDLLLTFGYDSERTTLALWLFMTGH